MTLSPAAGNELTVGHRYGTGYQLLAIIIQPVRRTWTWHSDTLTPVVSGWFTGVADIPDQAGTSLPYLANTDEGIVHQLLAKLRPGFEVKK